MSTQTKTRLLLLRTSDFVNFEFSKDEDTLQCRILLHWFEHASELRIVHIPLPSSSMMISESSVASWSGGRDDTKTFCEPKRKVTGFAWVSSYCEWRSAQWRLLSLKSAWFFFIQRAFFGLSLLIALCFLFFPSFMCFISTSIKLLF